MLDLREQTIGKQDIRRFVNFGQDHYVNPGSNGFHNFNQVTIEKFGVDSVCAEGANLALKIQGIESLDYRLARGFLLRKSTAVFKIKDDFVGCAGCRLGHHFERVRGAGQFAAADGKVMVAEAWIVIGRRH
jgi:hypothetical protein